jgi:outer membrane immunogenic protein
MIRSMLLGAVSAVAMLSSASAADMYAGGGYKDEPVVVNSWAGFYIGANGGYAWNPGDVAKSVYVTHGIGAAPVQGLEAEGGFGGGQIGYNFQRDRVVFGFETDIQGGDVRDSSTTTVTHFSNYTTPFTVAQKYDLDYFGTVRGRLGLTLLDGRGLVYVTGGFAYGGVDYAGTYTYSGGVAHYSKSTVETGYAAGFGAEYYVTPRFSVKAEYQLLALGHDSAVGAFSAPYTAFSAKSSFDNDIETVRLGVNYHLGHVYEPLK